jgi:non-ribosomal peptide synthetase component F
MALSERRTAALTLETMPTLFTVNQLTVLKPHLLWLLIAAIVCVGDHGGEASMSATAARHEAEKILAELADRISDVINPFARQSPDHPALVQGDFTWSYADLAAIVTSTAIALADYGVRPGDRVMIVSENSLALAAILLAASEIDAWSVIVNPRLSEREIDLIRDHSGARRVFYTIEVSDDARRHASRHGAVIAALDALGALGIGPVNEQAEPNQLRRIGHARSPHSSIPRGRPVIPRV